MKWQSRKVAILAGLAVAIGGFITVFTVNWPLHGRAPSKNGCIQSITDGRGPQSPASRRLSGDIRVVEKGYTMLPNQVVAIGAIIENSSDLVAYHVTVKFQVFDRNRRSIVGKTSPEPRTEVVAIPPGQRVGAGSRVLVGTGDYYPPTPATVSAFDVTATAAQWLTPTPGTHPMHVGTAAHYQRTDRKYSSAGDFFYSMDFPLCRKVERHGMSIIFRDQNGTLAGGLPVNPIGGESCFPGKHDYHLVVGGIPGKDKIDDRRTEIYAYCDLISPQNSSRDSSPATENTKAN